MFCDFGKNIGVCIEKSMFYCVCFLLSAKKVFVPPKLSCIKKPEGRRGDAGVRNPVAEHA